MSVNYKEQQAEQAAQEQKKQLDARNAEGWGKILAKYTIADNMANYTIVRDWSQPISLESFEALLRTNPKSLAMSSRDEIIQDIIDNSHGSRDELRQLKFRLSTYSLAQLRDKRRTIAFKEGVRTADQARAYVASQPKEIGWRGQGYPRLQSTTVPPGEYQPVPTGTYLRKLAKTDLYLFKRYVRLHGSEQIDWFLQNGN